MKNALFLTGASGFIGRHVLQELSSSRDSQIYCLCRHSTPLLEQLALARGNIHFLYGDIFDAAVYRSNLAACSTVVHLAAVTGKAAVQKYFTVNTEGTQFLLEQCKDVQVNRFLYVSTVAVKYSEAYRYYYAQSKKLGEELVKRSGIEYTIVRPAMVIGPGSPNLGGLRKLVRHNMIVVPGNGKARIQPIYVSDLARSLVTLLSEKEFNDATVEIGGPEQITLEDFLKDLYRICYQQEPPRITFIPLKPLILLLSLLETYCYPILPVNAGQLSVFQNDGVVQANSCHLVSRLPMRGVRDMLELSI